jgi:hypothetical protein
MTNLGFSGSTNQAAGERPRDRTTGAVGRAINRHRIPPESVR